MKSTLTILFFCISTLLVAQSNKSQTPNSENGEKFTYQVVGFVTMHKYDKDSMKIDPNSRKFEAGRFKYLKVGEDLFKDDGVEFNYVLFKLLSFKSKAKLSSDGSKMILTKKSSDIPIDTIPNTPNTLDIGDANDFFWMKADNYNNYLEKGYILKRFYTPIQPAYGASLSLPFKIRPSIGDTNMKITPELSLGGFFGMRKRLDPYKPIYLYFPVFTAGVTTIGINSDNTIQEQSTEDVQDGLVFARNFSIGSFIEFNDFQIGFVLGWDKAGGEIGQNWIYNDRPWYSFSIGYNFLRKSDE